MRYSDPLHAPSLADLFSLDGKTALVVGGAGLLGSEIGFALAELGADLVLASREAGRCRARAAEVAARFPQSSARGLPLDIADRASIGACASALEKDPGHLDILVNCGWSGRKNSFDSITDGDWDHDIEVCLNGVFRTIKAVVPLLRRRRGVILNVASMYGHVAPDHRLYDGAEYANPPSYGAAKAGIIQLTRYLASFLSPDGIRVNCISPGPFPFETTQREAPAFVARLAEKSPLGRIGTPHELKGAAALLCSDASSYITGQNLCVDGGWSVW